MIKGNRETLESEINEFIRSETFVQGSYEVVCDLKSRDYGNEHPPILYLGCGMTNRPTFIFGFCNQVEDLGAVIISHTYKPRSYLIAFIEAVKERFVDSSFEHKRSIVIQFGEAYRRLIEKSFEQSHETQTLDLKLLEVFEDRHEIEVLLKKVR